MSGETPRAATTILVELADDGFYRAYQPEVSLLGRGDTPADAVAHYAELVANVSEGTDPDRIATDGGGT